MTKTKGSRKSLISRRRIEIEHDGEVITANVAVIGKGRDIPREEKIRIAEVACRLYASDRYTLDECLSAVGVNSVSTWWKWIGEIDEIESLYQESITSKDHNYKHKLRERARTVAEKLIEGYRVELTEREGIAMTDDEGNPVGDIRMTRIKKKEVFVKPSVGLLQTVLFNFDRQNFQQSPPPVTPEDDRPPQDIRIEIVGGLLDPVTREEDIDEI